MVRRGSRCGSHRSNAISLHRIGLGLLLIVAFSPGLAASIAGVGLLAVAARGAVARIGLDGRLVWTLPAVGAVRVSGSP